MTSDQMYDAMLSAMSVGDYRKARRMANELFDALVEGARYPHDQDPETVDNCIARVLRNTQFLRNGQ